VRSLAGQVLQLTFYLGGRVGNKGGWVSRAETLTGPGVAIAIRPIAIISKKVEAFQKNRAMWLCRLRPAFPRCSMRYQEAGSDGRRQERLCDHRLRPGRACAIATQATHLASPSDHRPSGNVFGTVARDRDTRPSAIFFQKTESDLTRSARNSSTALGRHRAFRPHRVC